MSTPAKRLYAAAHQVDPSEVDEDESAFLEMALVLEDIEKSDIQTLAHLLGMPKNDEYTDSDIGDEIDDLRDELRRLQGIERAANAYVDAEFDDAEHGEKVWKDLIAALGGAS